MPKREMAHKCHNCKSTILIDLGVAAQFDSIVSDGSPGTSPNPMGTRWAVYECLACGFVGPWPKPYAASIQLAKDYKEFVVYCREVFNSKQTPVSTVKKLESLINSNKILDGFPSAGVSNESIDKIVKPLIEDYTKLKEYVLKRDQEHLEEIKKINEELKKRRGGRPKGSKTNRKNPVKGNRKCVLKILKTNMTI